MKLTHTVTRVDKGLGAIEKQFKLLRMKNAYVKAGVMGGGGTRDGLTNAQLAAIHEWGLGNVSARPWIRPPFLKNRDQYLELLKTAYQKAVRTNRVSEFERVLELIGLKMAADIKNYVTQGSNLKPLAESTIKRKGSSRPLVDTAQLVNSVTHKVVR